MNQNDTNDFRHASVRRFGREVKESNARQHLWTTHIPGVVRCPGGRQRFGVAGVRQDFCGCLTRFRFSTVGRVQELLARVMIHGRRAARCCNL